MEITKLIGESFSKHQSDYEFVGIDKDNNRVDICYRFKRIIVLSNDREIVNIKNPSFPDDLDEIQKVLIPLGITFSEGISLKNSLRTGK